MTWEQAPVFEKGKAIQRSVPVPINDSSLVSVKHRIYVINFIGFILREVTK